MVGIDEVGYGSWAGPLYICALRFLREPNFPLFDSKKISIKKRKELFFLINDIAEYRLGVATSLEINEFGLGAAYKLALFRATESFQDEFIIDGRKPSYFNCQAVIKGDSLIQEISAASIVAKVLRDQLMDEMHVKHPGYSFDKNKGYGTKIHIAALKKLGFCEIHRIVYNLQKYL